MCGIYGFVQLDRSKRADPAPLEAMGKSLVHRGPDDFGHMNDQYVAFGHRRLSIIDLSEHGRQPMSNEDGSVWVTFNGEIYNFQDHVDWLIGRGHRFRSHSDTEVILHLYEEFGIDCLDKLNGMFAFALWDKKKGEVFMARDRAGIKPLQYAVTGGQVVFASEIKALLKHPAVSKRIDPFAINEYLSFESVPGPRTIFSEIKKLLPGNYLKIVGGQVINERYWRPPYPAREARRSEEDYAEEFHGILRRVVKRHLISDVPLGVFLSGGVDSSSVAALMREITPGNIKSFNIAFQEKSFDESSYSRMVAKHLGTEHYTEVLDERKALELVPRIMDYLDEPFGDASFIPTFLLSRFTRQHVTVTLSGDGPDELFSGYPTYLAHRAARVLGKFPKALLRSVNGLLGMIPPSDKNLTFGYQLQKMLSGLIEPSPVKRNYVWLGSFPSSEKPGLLAPGIMDQVSGVDEYGEAEEYFASCQADDLLEKILYCDQRFYMQDDILTKVDRASMAHSLEARVPFLDREVLEFAARLPIGLKLKGRTTKYILKKTMKDRLPKAVLARPKKGFGIPVAQWFKNELKPLLMDQFEESKLRREGIFRPEYVQTLLREHFENKKDNRKQLYTLLAFELWYEKYIR